MPRILICGVGGLGVEVAKNLVLLGYREIDLLDYDVIDMSNISRTLYYHETDLGHYKATRLLQRLTLEYPTFRGSAITDRLGTKRPEFYGNYDIIFSCLDNVQGRRELNARFIYQCQVRNQQPEGNTFPSCTTTLLIDGGTEGWYGHCRIIYGGGGRGGQDLKTSCIECHLDLYPPWWQAMKEEAGGGGLSCSAALSSEPLQQQQQEKEKKQELIVIPTLLTTNAIIAGMMILQMQSLLTKLSLYDRSGSREMTDLLHCDAKDGRCPFPDMHQFVFVNTKEGLFINKVPLKPNPDCVVCGQNNNIAYK
jgi:molybdopterin/thiamine biosynthesis adenylyltransferase